MKKSLFILLFLATVMISCEPGNSKKVSNLEVKEGSGEVVSESVNENVESQNTIKSSDDSSKAENDSSKSNLNSTNQSKDTEKSVNDFSNENIKEKVIDYIINGQDNKIEAEKLKWSEAFLNELDIETLYEQYKANGGNPDDLEAISQYITLNATIPEDWEKLFEKDLYDMYGKKVVRIEKLEGELYQAYVDIEGKEVPYVVVSSRTGYFHG